MTPSMSKVENGQCYMCDRRVTVLIEFRLRGLGGPGPSFCSDCLARALSLTGEFWGSEPVNDGATLRAEDAE